jgi:alanine racemase
MSTIAASRAIVDLGAYGHNLAEVRRLVGDKVGIIPVLKANAYGHGLTALARAALSSKVQMLGVATVDEGVILREAGIEGPILILGQPDVQALESLVAFQLTPTLSDVSLAKKLGAIAHRTNKVIPVHCKIDSGMGRQGFSLEHAAKDIQQLTRISPIDIEGISTHFPAADQFDDSLTHNQVRLFKQLLRKLDKEGIPYEVVHAANSAAVLNYPGSFLDMVRVGLMTYGVHPVEEQGSPVDLKPVLRWETRVIQVRELMPGATIGYGRTYTTKAPMRTAVLPVGYADGYKHSLSNRAEVLIHGTRCAVRGSVCMDQIVVDVTALKQVTPGDVATLIGQDGKESITASELATRAGTIPYEILTGIGPRVAREYIGATQ